MQDRLDAEKPRPDAGWRPADLNVWCRGHRLLALHVAVSRLNRLSAAEYAVLALPPPITVRSALAALGEQFGAAAPPGQPGGGLNGGRFSLLCLVRDRYCPPR